MDNSAGRISLRERMESDLRMARALVRIGPASIRNRPGASTTVADRFEALADADPDRVAIIDAHDDGREITWAQLDQRANRVAHWALANDIGHGRVVALLMLNRPEYVSTWLGLAKVGAVTALINTNLTGEPLRHSIRVSGADHLIVDAELADEWAAARDGAGSEAPPTEWGHDRFETTLAEQPDVRPVDARIGLDNTAPLFFIYTSGTTGLPKAAKFSHGKFINVANGLNALVDIRADDRMYDVLPLYHTAGGVMALGGPLLAGATVVLARKFSARGFWDDCARYGATLFQYIGELCRYLANSPSHPLERGHRLRLAVGNGLRPDVWPEFQERFRIDQIVEFYGATEGTMSLFNLDNRVGAIGRMHPGLAKRLGIHLVEYDIEADEIRRDENGRVIPVDANTPGEAISRISDFVPFEGYSDDEATERKILRDAFRDGDAYFRSGDLLSQDADGYYYFVDRVGDTFRWKAENVSTAEVAQVLGVCAGVREANVYGVEVPGADGRAGMATLVVDDDFDIDEIHDHVVASLAAYARPLFLRVQSEVEITATFKHRKREAVREGFDPAIDDPLWFLDPGEKRYVVLDDALHRRIVEGDVRL